MMRSVRMLLFVVLAAVTAAGDPQAVPPTYTILEVAGIPGTVYSFAEKINDAGQVVGRSYASDDRGLRAFLWSSGTAVDLGTLGRATIATGLNGAGEVCGRSTLPSGEEHAFKYSGGQLVDLGTLGGASSRAWAINDAGHVVGQSQNAAGQQRAFLYRNGTMTDLGTLGGDESAAFAINSAGDVVGMSTVAPGEPWAHAFLWRNGVMTDLETLGGRLSWAIGINEAGDVAGTSTNARATAHGVLFRGGLLFSFSVSGEPTEAYAINEAGHMIGSGWTNNHQVVAGYWFEVGPTGGSRAQIIQGSPAVRTIPYALNESDQVVGQETDIGGQPWAFLFLGSVFDGDRHFDLETLIPPGSGWNLEAARDINEAGQIVGYGTIGGRTAGFLLQPVP